MQRILPPILVTALAVVMIALSLVVPGLNTGWPVRILGGAVLTGGGVLCMYNARLFGRLETNIVTFDDPDKLVLSGAFGWTRNPMYLGFFVMLIGLAIALGSLVAMIGPALFFVAADRWYIPFEERRMAATFGPDYDQYRRSVRRWIGRTTS